jgi:UDP-2-acetamido-3-amino-2,3-dideoxy-glucuronate N-acetyltransferase
MVQSFGFHHPELLALLAEGAPLAMETAFMEGIHPSAFVHESAYVDAPCRIGPRSQVMHFTHVMAQSMVGSDCRIAQHVTVYPGVMLGHRVVVMENVRLNSGVIVQDDVYCGPSVTVSGASKLRAAPSLDKTTGVSPTLIKRHAIVGANVAIAGGITIGQHAFVEGASVVDKHVPDYAIVRGNPLRLVGWRCVCGQGLHFTANKIMLGGSKNQPKTMQAHTECTACGQAYSQTAPHTVVQCEKPNGITQRVC